MRRAAAGAVALLMAGVTAAAAQGGPEGTYSGSYQCGQGSTALSLTVTRAPDGGLSALFYFHRLASNPNVPSGCFTMRGQYSEMSGAVALRADTWLLRPPGYVTVDLKGQLVGTGLSGLVIGPGCSSFSLQADPLPPAAPPACRAPAPADDNRI
jgi:hypothetical protein